MAYLGANANLYLVGSANDIYRYLYQLCRMDLSLGKFNIPLESSADEINSISINKSIPIFTIAGYLFVYIVTTESSRLGIIEAM